MTTKDNGAAPEPEQGYQVEPAGIIEQLMNQLAAATYELAVQRAAVTQLRHDLELAQAAQARPVMTTPIKG